MNALEIQNVTKAYSNHVALDDVSISIPQQSIYGLLGPNGAGKTTLIRIINKIIDQDEGDVLLNGKSMQREDILKIGYLPEERGLYKKMKIGEQLIYLARLKGLSRHDARRGAKHWLGKFEIADWWEKKIEDLSKGMAQKVQFINTVLHQPKLIILDEPFSGFDPINAKLITQEILELQKQGATIIFSTHRMETVEDLCDHIALINNSKKLLDGTKQEVRDWFKNNCYTIEHDSEFTPKEDFILLEQIHLNDAHYRSTIQIPDHSSTNALLEAVLKSTTIISFEEKIPSISDIFIEMVKNDKTIDANTQIDAIN